MPLGFSIQILGNENYYGDGIAKAFREQFVKAPDVSVSVKKINTGNFISNKAEQDLVKGFAGKDVYRPQLREIYLDDGYAVATNAHILLAIYDKKLLGKDKYFDASKNNTPYPKWRGVVPTHSLTTQKINAKELLDFTNKVIKYGATNPTTKGVILKLGDNNYGFNISLLSQCLKAMMQLGKDDIYVHFTDGSTNRAVILTHIENWDLNKPDSTFALIMPIRVMDTFKDYLNYDVNDNTFFAKGGELDSDEIIETIWESNNTGRFIETKDGLKTRDSFASFVKKNDPNYTADAIFDSNVYNGVITVGSSQMDREEFRDYVGKAKQKKSSRWFNDGGRIDRNVAMTILEQLGGQRKLQMFTGAHSFVALPNGVVFKIKNRSINNVMITLNSNDLYDLYFSKTSGVKMTNVKEFKNIYNDQLIDIFEDVTGMYLSFATGGTLPTNFGQSGLVGDTGAMSEMELFAMGGNLPQGMQQFYQQTYNPNIATPQGYAKGGTVKKSGKGANMLLAKEIRKEGESWRNALKRAGEILKKK
jgi:hypothetical protein